jgi:hypothetical protein
MEGDALGDIVEKLKEEAEREALEDMLVEGS